MQKIIAIIGILISISILGKTQQKWDRPMELKSCSIEINADHFIATTFIEMEFCNPNGREIEGLYRFNLKPGQVITAFQLDLNGKYRDGSIEEKWKATNAYNSIVGKRIDPALLTMDYAGQYSLCIYPVPANGCRKVTMTIQQVLDAEKNNLQYFFPLNIPDTVQFFKMNISVDGHAKPFAKKGLIVNQYFTSFNSKYNLTWITEKKLLKSPIIFSIPHSIKPEFCFKPSEVKTYFALRFLPSFQREYTIKPKQLAIFWDASASLNKRNIGKEISFLKQFISRHNISQLTIISFNHKLLDTAVFYTENGFNSRWQQYLQNITYDGATQLGIIDLSEVTSDMVLLFTDGNNTYGKSIPKTGNTIISCIHSSNISNLSALQQIAGASGGKVIDLNKTSISTAVSDCSSGENWLINVSSASGKTIIEQTMPLKQEKTIFINGTMGPGIDTLYFQYGNNGRVNHIEKITVNSAMGCFSSAIDRINMLNNFENIIHTYSWSNIIDFGLQEKIVTPNTAFIILERVEDYVKYNIAPPKELEEECERMNYVKRDTRFERKRIEKASEYDILKNVVNIYNERIRIWDAAEKYISQEKSQFDKTIGPVQSDILISSRLPVENILSGKTAGIDIKTNALEEVVVVEHGVMNKKMLTGSAAYLRSQDIFSSVTSVEQALQGRVPGLQVFNSSGIYGNSATISIRGAGALNINQPLFVVDGTPVSGNIINIVNVHDIENITVLKGNAAALYGSRAANGAIIINMKRGKNYFNYYNSKPYRLKDMEDVEYLQEIKNASGSEKNSAYERLKEEYGGKAGFYFDVAQHFFETGYKEKAFNILINAAEAANGNQQVIVAIAYIFESWHQFSDAIDIYEKLIKNNPNNLVFHCDLAWAHYQSANYQQAINILYQAVKMNTGQQEHANLYLKSMLLNDMNAIISLHKDSLDVSGIPLTLIRPMPVDMRIVIDCNKSNMTNVSIKEPGNYICNYSNPVTKNGGTIQQGYYWYTGNPFEYQLKKAPKGNYKIRVNFYDYYTYNGKIPSLIRIRKFKNFGKGNQSIDVENVMMDNQYGEIEIAVVKW